ncbi:hypothetical protein [Mycolicibacterium sp. XJ1819]
MTRKQRKQLKWMSASIGTAAVIAMAVLGASSGISPGGAEAQGPEITTGETTTSTTAPTELETAKATPEVTAEPAPTAD